MTTVVSVFVIVYWGMLLGGLPFLQIDRTGVALLGVIVLIVSQAVTFKEAGQAVHVPTLVILFSFMVIAAQMQLGGFYTWVTTRLDTLPLRPPGLLAAVIVVVGALSAVFSNDVVCLAVAPVLISICRRRQFDPVAFLLGLACAANIGSAATLIGNPQNILIGSRLGVPFMDYLQAAAFPVAAGLGTVWLVIVVFWRGRWQTSSAVTAPCSEQAQSIAESSFQCRWQSFKGLAVAGALLALFLCSDWPREVAALGGAGLLLLSRKLHSRDMLGLVDWSVLILFISLFIVNDALAKTGVPRQLVQDSAELGINLHLPLVLYAVTAVLSNMVSNVPAIMLLLPTVSTNDGLLLALSSTLSGNLLIVGSIANIIVVDTAAKHGIRIGWKQHALVGVPVTLLTLGMTAVYLLNSPPYSAPGGYGALTIDSVSCAQATLF